VGLQVGDEMQGTAEVAKAHAW